MVRPTGMLLGGGLGQLGLGAAGAFSPLTIGSVLAWYDALDASTLWTTPSRSAQPSDTDDVGAWDDKSGNGNHVENSTAAACPHYSEGAFGTGQHGVHFDAVSSHELKNSSHYMPTGAVTVVVVCKSSLAAAKSVISVHNNTWVMAFEFSSSKTILRRGSTNFTYFDPAAETADGQQHIFEFSSPGQSTSDPANNAFYIDGAAQNIESTNAGAAGGYAGSTLYVGSAGLNGVYFDGPIGELIVFSKQLSASERSALNAYLKDRWGTP